MAAALEEVAQAGNGRAGQYLTFVVGRETYGLAILGIREIIQYTAPTEVPGVPGHIRGVINLRGAVVPVVDLSVRFGRPSAAVGKRTCIVVIELEAHGQSHRLGVMVDAVTEVLVIGAADIEVTPSFGGGIRMDFIAGLGKVKGRFVILLNPERVFSLDEIRVIADAADHPA
jgi:purine-binding chemotaxis protein CheW